MNRKKGIKHLNNTGLTSLLIVVLQLGVWFYMPVHRLTAHGNTHCCDSEGKCDTSNHEPCAICDFNFWFYLASQKTELPQTEYRLINTTYNQIVEIVYPEYTFHYYRRGPP